jgi:class 3 adenylate cyclase
MKQATLVGSLTTCAPVALAAAKAPDRITGLVLFRPLACGPLAPGAGEHGWPADEAAAYAAGWRAVMDRWGSGATLEMWDPVLATPYNRRLMAMLERCSATPAFAKTYLEAALTIDSSDFLPAVQAKTRVLYPPTSREPRAVIRRTAELVPNATFHELPPTPPGASIGESYVDVWHHLAEVATGQPRRPDADRFLGTVLFTDVVASTELLARLGDAQYRDLHAAHARHVRLSVERAGGRLVNVTGDGTFSLFDGPTRAVRCADEIRRAAGELGIDIRAGVHTGELERTGVDVAGLTVNIGARISALAGPGEVLVSSTVRDLVLGSGLGFADRGPQQLKGVPGERVICALTSVDGEQVHLPTERSLATPLDRAALRTARTAPRVARTAMRVGNALQRYRARARI